MDMETWIPIYREIAKDLGLSEEDDRKSAKVLVKEIDENPLILDGDSVFRRATNLIENRTCLVIGGGPGLEDEVSDLISRISDPDIRSRITIITADGSTSLLYKSGIVPDLIVTDLDGGIEDQIKAVGEGALMILHAHGDNGKILKDAVRKLTGMVLASTQVDPREVPGSVNFGGFTDGDRAVHMADSLGASRVILVGFDMGLVAGKLDENGARISMEGQARERKRIKLGWADRLLNMVSRTPILHYPEMDKSL
jgi:uncharacterized Rossmann fold enzyme